jgi:hypothetical protein
MAHVNLIYDIEQSTCFVVPFAVNPRVGNAPTAAGPMIRFPFAELETIGIPAVRQQLIAYATNDVEQPSEFYELLDERERESILARSIKINVAARRDRETVFLTSPVRGRNIEASIPWKASDGEVAAAIQRFVRKVALIKHAV